jgi:hypothetical protein
MGGSTHSAIATTESQTTAALLRKIEILERERACGRALIVTLQEAERAARDQIAHLETALVSARRIGAAIGIIMARCQVTDDHAFALLRTTSQLTHRKVRDIAEDVVLTGALPTLDGRPDAPRRSRSGAP